MSDKKTAAPKSWPDSEVKALIAAYTAAGFDNSKLGELMAGKTAAQCRSKLVSLGEYKKAEEAKKAIAEGGTGKKIEIVNAVEIFAGLAKGSLASLEKASKSELELLARRMTELSDQYNATIPADADPARRAVDVEGYQTADIADAEPVTSGM